MLGSGLDGEEGDRAAVIVDHVLVVDVVAARGHDAHLVQGLGLG